MSNVARPRTAGVILVDAAMRNEPLADTLTKLLPHQDAIAALDADGQNQIVAALRPLSELPTDVTGDAADLAKMLNGGRGNALADRAQDILDIKALQPHGNQAYELGQTVGGLAVGLYSAGDTEKSLDLLAHWQQLLEKHAANQGGHYSNRLTSDLRQMMWNRGDHPDLSPVLLVNAMATDARLAPITDNRLLSALEYPFDNVIDNLPPAPGAATDNSGRWFAGLDQLATRRPDLHNRSGRAAHGPHARSIQRRAVGSHRPGLCRRPPQRPGHRRDCPRVHPPGDPHPGLAATELACPRQSRSRRGQPLG